MQIAQSAREIKQLRRRLQVVDQRCLPRGDLLRLGIFIRRSAGLIRELGAHLEEPIDELNGIFY